MSFSRRLKQRCTIQTRSEGAQDDWNTSAVTFITPDGYTSVPCFVYTQSGAEYTEAQRVAQEDRVLFDLMPTVPITRRDRILYAGEVYEVEQVAGVGGGHHLVAKTTQVEV